MSFCTAINCMDGRVQVPVTEYLKHRFGVEYVDMITEPGPNRILASQDDERAVESIFERVRISVQNHGSVGIAVAGHYDCAGNPASQAQQGRDTQAAVEYVRQRFGELPVIGLWVEYNGEVSEIK